MDIIAHNSISDLYKSLNLPVEQELDFTIHFLPDLHQSIPFKSPNFRAEYFSFVFVKDGRGNYTTDTQTFPFQARTVYFTNPGHIKAFEMLDLEDAYIITLTESFLRENVHSNIFDEFPFLLAEIVPPKVLPKEEFSDFEVIYIQIFKEFAKKSVYKDKILGNLFVVLLLKIKEKFWSDYDPISEGNRNSQIVKSFKKLLKEKFENSTLKDWGYSFQVQDYANELNLHPNYLGNVIKSKTGKTVNNWINERMIVTAKYFLKNSEISAKEVSYRLGFSEPTHFSRFFKKHTGFTPSNYKKST